jgi:hypothetical protein
MHGMPGDSPHEASDRFPGLFRTGTFSASVGSPVPFPFKDSAKKIVIFN